MFLLQYTGSLGVYKRVFMKIADWKVSVFAEDYFPEVVGESAVHRRLRHTNYEECWGLIRAEIEVAPR